MDGRKKDDSSAGQIPGGIRAPSPLVLDGLSNPPANGYWIVAIPFTTTRETKRALTLVSSLVADLNASVVIVVPVVVPWQLPLARPGVATEAWRRRMVRELKLPDGQIHLLRVLCRDSHSAWDRVLRQFDYIVCGCSPGSALGERLTRWRETEVQVFFADRSQAGQRTRFMTWLCRLIRFLRKRPP